MKSILENRPELAYEVNQAAEVAVNPRVDSQNTCRN